MAVLADNTHRNRLQRRINSVIYRCTNSKCKAYVDYGGRGISVYVPWIEDRVAFLRYLVTLPGWDNPDLELDRRDNDGNYEPGNLRFVTRKQNIGNRRNVTSLQVKINDQLAEIEQTKALLQAALLAGPFEWVNGCFSIHTGLTYAADLELSYVRNLADSCRIQSQSFIPL